MKRYIIPVIILSLLLGCQKIEEPFIIPEGVISLKVSSVFEDGSPIPAKYTCQGEDMNPPLEIQDVPENVESLVLVIDDPDAPMGIWDHWIVWNIDPSTKRIEEDSVPGVEGMNSFRKTSYGGPCPPPGASHRYRFKLYALDTKLDLDSSANKRDVEEAMEGHIVGQAILIGTCQR